MHCVSGVRGGVAFAIDQMQLAMLAALVAGEQQRTTSIGAMPCASCVESARAVERIDQRLRRERRRLPARAYGQSAPTAKKRLAIATPNRRLASRATIDQVMRA